MKNWLFLYVVGGIAAVCALGSAVTALIWSWPDSILKLTSPIQVVGKQFHSGDWLEYRMSYCKTKDIEGEVHLSWIDGVAYPMPGMTLHMLKIGCNSVLEGVRIPSIPTGYYRLEMVRVYAASPMRQITVRSTSGYFSVIHGSLGADQ